MGIVTFAKHRILYWRAAIVIERRAPQKCPVRHHALLHFVDHRGVAAYRATTVLGHTKVARIHEADELVRFLVKQRVGAYGVRG